MNSGILTLRSVNTARGRRKVEFFFGLLTNDISELKKWHDILSLDMNNLSAANIERVCSEYFNPDDILVVMRKMKCEYFPFILFTHVYDQVVIYRLLTD